MPDPWIGGSYHESRLLLLGESAYSEEDEEGKLRPLNSQHLTSLVQHSIDHFPTLRFFNMITRGLAGKNSPSNEERHKAWSRVAFVNFVPESVGAGSRIRPSAELWELARQGFRPLLEQLKPQTVVVLGKLMWYRMPDADLWITDDVQGYRLSDGSTAMFWIVNHPAGSLSWQRLRQVIAFAAGRECAYDVGVDR